jgi:hypothetical protein
VLLTVPVGGIKAGSGCVIPLARRKEGRKEGRKKRKGRTTRGSKGKTRKNRATGGRSKTNYNNTADTGVNEEA